ncbi:MAG: tetratricopeptide repeat protein [Gemmatimonadota bacterium]
MTNRPSSLQALFAELKRRRVFRVMAVYGAVAFIVLQAADLVFPILELPNWTLQFVLMITLLGFPLAIVIAWAFEATDEGIRRAVPADEEEIRAIVALPASRRWPAGLMALAGMGLLFWSGWWLGNRGGLEGGANLLVGEAQAADFRTLAALPFRNVNGDEDNGIIAIGIHEDLLAQLSRIAALRVTSRTSVSEYQETDKSLKDIAGELGVEYLLEGSVQSSGPRVRVHVRLVDAATDQALWTHQFDQEVTPENLFDIQSEISRTVVEELEAHLTPQESATLAAMEPSGSSAAQQWYYRGLAKAAGPLSDLPEARDAFAQAVAIDSTYAAAWSQLARVASRLVFTGGLAEDSTAARTAAERAAALQPNSVEAHLARGYNEYYARQNFDAALSAFRAAERLAPSDADAVWAVGLILRRQGEWEESTAMMKRAARLDPRNLSRLETLAENLADQGAYADADAVIERALSVDPTNPKARSSKVNNLFLWDGDTKRAHGLAAELRLDPRRFDEGQQLIILAYADRDYRRILELSSALETRGVPYFELVAAWWALVAAHQLDYPGVEALADSVHALVPGAVPPDAVPALQGMAAALGGRREQGLEELRLAVSQVREWNDHILNPPLANAIVVGYGALGELDAGFEVLDDHVARPGNVFTATHLRTSPAFDPYRDDPRFAEMLERRERFEAAGAKMGEAGRPWLP